MSEETSIIFPRSIGSTSVVKLDEKKTMKLFLVDEALPLFNVTFEQLRFFANADQVRLQMKRYSEAGNGKMPEPTWKWQFDSGLELSIDGKADAAWRLQDFEIEQ